MNPTGRLPRNSTKWLLDSQLAPFADSFKHHLTERGYASSSVDTYVACIAEFALWISQCGLEVDGVDEDAVQRFLDKTCSNARMRRREGESTAICAPRSGICLYYFAPSPSLPSAVRERPRWTRSCVVSTTI